MAPVRARRDGSERARALKRPSTMTAAFPGAIAHRGIRTADPVLQRLQAATIPQMDRRQLAFDPVRSYIRGTRNNARAAMTIDEIRDNFALLDDWDDRYRYVIELGRMLDPMPDADHSAANKVQGCASQVWLSRELARNDHNEPVL